MKEPDDFVGPLLHVLRADVGGFSVRAGSSMPTTAMVVVPSTLRPLPGEQGGGGQDGEDGVAEHG